MNNLEYNKNQKEQKKSFKKYRKYMGKILLWGGIALASAFIAPYGLMLGALKPLIGESLAMNATFFTQWGIAAFGALRAGINAAKAHHERKKIDDAQDEQEDIVDSMINENDNLKRKVENLEKQKVKEEDKSYEKTNNNLVKSNQGIDYDEEEEKKHTK